MKLYNENGNVSTDQATDADRGTFWMMEDIILIQISLISQNLIYKKFLFFIFFYFLKFQKIISISPTKIACVKKH